LAETGTPMAAPSTTAARPDIDLDTWANGGAVRLAGGLRAALARTALAKG